MFTSMARTIEQFKQSWCRELEDDAIDRAVRETGHVWRDRKLNPVTTVRLFLLQILFGNVACNYVPHLAGKKVTGSAYCEARARLPLEALQTLMARCTTKMGERVCDAGLWLGHRLFIMDGSSFSMSDTDELREHFGQSGQQAAGCGFPTAHWLALVHFGSGLFQQVIASALRTHDLSGASRLHAELQAEDVLAGDRAFCSYAHLALLCARSVYAVVRAHQKLIVDFTPGRPHVEPGRGKSAHKLGKPRSRWIATLGHCDQIVEWLRPVERPVWLSAEAFAALPLTLRVRELRYTVARPGFRGQAGHAGHHAAGPRDLHRGKTGRGVRPALDDRNMLRSSQDDHEDGCASLPDGPRRDEGTDDVPVGLQLGPHDTDAGGKTTARTDRENQLRGCVALAGHRSGRRPTAAASRQCAPTRPLRTTLP